MVQFGSKAHGATVDAAGTVVVVTPGSGFWPGRVTFVSGGRLHSHCMCTLAGRYEIASSHGRTCALSVPVCSATVGDA